ncbi:MAG: hypothetical protein ACI3YC_05225 [Alloprevotella sp.]
METPPKFSMPMFKDVVAKPLRPWLYVLLAFCFQFSGGMYMGALNHLIGEHAVMREDVLMCLYSTLIGMALYFPLLFRMKFRFTNRLLLCTSAAVILGCNVLTTLPLSMPVLWGLCFICGMAKIQGTFECMSNIQLWMTPKRDFAVFFPLLHVILLASIEVTAFLSAFWAFRCHWTLMHWFVCGLMLFVLLLQWLFTKPFRPMPQIVPLKDIDWVGFLLWGALCFQIACVLNYGDWLDWWHSRYVRLLCGTSLITLAICLQRMLHHPHPYFEPAMWTYRHVVSIILLIGLVEALFSAEHVLETIFHEEILGHPDHITEQFRLWALPGILAGCLFSLGWLKLMKWNVYKLIAVGLLVFSIYAAGYYFQMDSSLSLKMLRVPLMCRGFSYAVLSIAFMWSLHEIMSFQHFFQSLAIFNVLHMFVGGLIGSAFHAHALKMLMGEQMAHLSARLDAVRISPMLLSDGAFMDSVVTAGLVRSLKVLFGWTLLGALFFAMLMLLWDIPFVRRRIKQFRPWTLVGVSVLNGYRRRRRLHRIRVMRRETMSVAVSR